MANSWEAASTSYEPPQFFQGGTKSVTMSNDDIYILAPTAQTAYTSDLYGWLWKSTDGGNNFTKANTTDLSGNWSTNSGGYALVAVGTDIACFLSNSTDLHGITFDTTTDSWGSGTTLGGIGNGASIYRVDASYESSTVINVTHTHGEEKIMGTSWNRVGWVPYNPSTEAFGTDTLFEVTGLSADQACGPSATDSNGDVHAIVMDQYNTSGTWEHFEYTTSVQGPHSLPTDFFDFYTSAPRMYIFTQGSTERLYLMHRNTSGYMSIWESANGSSWSTAAISTTDSNYRPAGIDGSMLMDSNDTITVFIGYYDSGTPKHGVAAFSKSSGGSWSDDGLLWDNATYGTWRVEGAWGDTTNDYAFISAMGVVVSNSYDRLTGILLGGLTTRSKSHTSDMYLSLPGAVAGFYCPAAAIPGHVTSSAAVGLTWGVKDDDPKTLVGRQWLSPDPRGDGYNYSTNGPSHTFDANIAAYDVDEDYGWVVVQLVNGELYAGTFDWDRSTYSYNSAYYYNDWRRDQGRYTNGPHMEPRKIANAPSTLPDKWGIRVTQDGTTTYGMGATIIANYEKVGGVNKVSWCVPIMDEDDPDVWGDGDASFNPQTTHGMYNTPPQLLDPSNTTYDEYVVGIAQTKYAHDYESWFYWVREETSNTYVYGHLMPTTNVQEIWTTATSGGFTVNYPSDAFNNESATINYNDTNTTVQTKLAAMSAINTVAVTGAGTKASPWQITLTLINTGTGTANPQPYNAFYEGTTNTLSGGGGPYITKAADPVKIVEVKHETIPRIEYQDQYFDFDTAGAERHCYMYMTDTDGKLSIMRPVAPGSLQPSYGDRWQFIAKSVSSGNVAHLNGVTQATGWKGNMGLKEGESGVMISDVLWNHVVYVDDTTKDLKMLVGANLVIYTGDGSEYPNG